MWSLMWELSANFKFNRRAYEFLQSESSVWHKESTIYLCSQHLFSLIAFRIYTTSITQFLLEHVSWEFQLFSTIEFHTSYITWSSFWAPEPASSMKCCQIVVTMLLHTMFQFDVLY